MKQHFKIKKKSTNRTINHVFSELIDKLGGKYSARFLYQSAERIVNLHLKSTKFNEGYGRPNFHSCGYFSKDVISIPILHCLLCSLGSSTLHGSSD